MTNKKNSSTTPMNDKGQRHGYWKIYNIDGKIMYSGHYINGVKVGFEMWNHNNVIRGIEKTYYIK